MKHAYLLLNLLIATNAFCQSIIGAWEAQYINEQGIEVRNVAIFSANGFQVATEYDLIGNFLSTNGGLWAMKGNELTETVEFDTRTPERVGSSETFIIQLTDSTLTTKGAPLWKKIDHGSPGLLAGAWIMSGRKRNGTIVTRDTNVPRKTMKILSGTRFQWIAYNTETKEFFGTGGGNYTSINGKYTEYIEFFSRDVERVGDKLQFDYKFIDEKWHHSGFSSKGEPLYEVWSLR